MSSLADGQEGLLRQTVVSWGDPWAIYSAHKHMTSIDLFCAIKDGKLPLEPTLALLGAEIVSVEAGEVTMALDLGERHMDHTGYLQSGIIAAMTDTAAGYAVHTCAPVGVRCASVELHVSLIAPVPLAAGRITVVGRAVHVDRQIATCEATVSDAAGTLFARMGMTMMVLPGDTG